MFKWLEKAVKSIVGGVGSILGIGGKSNSSSPAPIQDKPKEATSIGDINRTETVAPQGSTSKATSNPMVKRRVRRSLSIAGSIGTPGLET